MLLAIHHVAMASERPYLDHDTFLLPDRQRAAARALLDYGARACCTGDDECRSHRRALGEHGEQLRCAPVAAVPQCGGQRGLVIMNQFHAGCHSLEELEGLLRRLG